MNNEVELISDGDGLAVIGNPTAVERFMASVGLSSNAGSPRLGAAFSAGASVAQTGSEIAANSGRWVKLTEESAQAVKKFGLMPTKTPGVSHAMVGQPGDIKQWIQIVKSPGSMVTNPAMLAGAAGIMAQIAMQQQMDEITDYLATIDEKLDDVLRAQTNQVLARLDGVDLAVREAMSVREAVGRVSEVTWSKVQNSAQTIHETQGYALRQLGDLADKIEEKTKIGDLAETAKEAEAEVQKWLVVLARCFELHDAVGVLELDRVLDASPDELDRHRLGLKSARRDRLELISERTERSVGPHECGCWHGQLEGAVQSEAVAGGGQVEQPCRSRGPRVSRAARDRVWSRVVRGETHGGKRPPSAGTRRARPEHRGVDSASSSFGERDPRPGQIGEGQALRPDRRAKAPSERRR